MIKKIKQYSLILILFLVSVLSINFAKYKNGIELTQLCDNTPKQMMGYIIKTKNDEVIVIDGGEPGDAENLKNQISQNGNKVDYWIITHPHIDHMGAFMEIAQNTDIEIGMIITTLNDEQWYKIMLWLKKELMNLKMQSIL